MLVAVHNPANLPMKIASIAVPHGNLAVKRFDVTLGTMVDASADVLCDMQEEELYPSKQVNNCQLYIKHDLESNALGFLTVSYDPTADLTIPVSRNTNEDFTLESEDLILTYMADYINEGVFFKLTDKLSSESKMLGFDLRYWQSFQSENQQNSGVYIFRPQDGQYDSYQYSKLSSIGISRGTVRQQFILTFKAQDATNGDAVVRVMIEDLPVLRVDVELFGIPYNKKIGHEVTVNFLAPELDNQGVFYTDSNGMAMQKRILNYRPTWNLDLTANQNITANYYPIGSAIAIRDSDW